MWILNQGTAVSIPTVGGGLHQDGDWFEVDDAIGAKLLEQERFSECDEHGKLVGAVAGTSPEPVTKLGSTPLPDMKPMTTQDAPAVAAGDSVSKPEGTP